MTLDRENISDKLAAVGYIADRDIATALWLMEFLKRPLLLEGEAGVGKTEVAKALAAVHGSELIRLQCYEGLDQNAALYEWNYQRQLLAIKTREGVGEDANAIEEHIFSEKYLLERPLLAAIRRATPPVLLVDEVDRADEEFEAFLLELLSDFQVSIPELGTIKATSIPRVVLTSNGTRELSDALALPLSLRRFPRRRSRGEDHPGAHAGHRHHARFADRPHGCRGAQRGFA
jgi:MoxR-like ATPase